MDTQHRKIELQSPADLVYLQNQIRALALQKLNLHLPAVPNDSAAAPEPDELRHKTEDLVNAFVAQVLEGMRQNISINGNDVVDSEQEGGAVGQSVIEIEEFEAYDEKLRQRLADLNVRRDKLIGKISQHRRNTPALAAQSFREGFERDLETLEKDRIAGEEGARSVVGEQGGVVTGVEGFKRHEEVRRNWERAVEGLARLDKGLPETRARLERCGDVVGYLEGKAKSEKEI
ncbi:hypothetical protein B0J11DRAFT_540005 [Dendryphion nanum]|uniref:Uncharacterized protein n=1 Tax=Dendryphion nanum TaxID=256645 RepID=A0A9P9D9Q1_9PLEO|nr:hypothetical protein B0J11DRAFT_540005 [Dendryphion nanum]